MDHCFYVNSRDGDLIFCNFLDKYVYEGFCNFRECEYYLDYDLELENEKD